MFGEKFEWLRRGVAVTALLLVAGLLLTSHSDRQYINLSALEGIAAGVPLEAGKQYKQTFIATRTSLTRLGAVLRLTAGAGSEESIVIELRRGSQVLAAARVLAAFIDNTDATFVRFDRGISTTLGEELSFQITVPEELSGQVRAQTRPPDETFDATNVAFLIDGVQQPAPLGYQVFYDYHSPFAAQLGGLSLLAALGVMAWPYLRRHPTWFTSIYLVTIAILAILPRLFIAPLPWALLAGQVAALVGMYYFMRRLGVDRISALLAAQVFALTSWWPLHLLRDWPHMQLIIPQVAALKDIFLDTYQVASSIKVPGGASWDHYGSYIGIPATVLAVVGIGSSWRRRWWYLVIGLIGLCLVYVWPHVPHAIILTTFTLAICSGLGLHQLRRYLGADDRLVRLLTIIILLVCLLDLFYVLAGPLEYGILSQEQIWRS